MFLLFMNLPEDKSEQEDEYDGMEDETKNSRGTGICYRCCLRPEQSSEQFVGQLVKEARRENQEKETCYEGSQPFLLVAQFQLEQFSNTQVRFVSDRNV
jgi:hypothetical protein